MSAVAPSAKRLSATMVGCIDLAAEHGGELVRFAGGFWAGRNAARASDGIPRPYYGASTIQALVSRGYAGYSEYRQGRDYRFPIAITLTAQARGESL